ncbi:juvenile hormone acid O-methyltransferase-like [Dermacentor variabilis]|uniref:juvenile hormone acid O-methyltransferase-like n=1 Tax=Dermacentor variabilis TaxID=34621 RepID=UPI003F5BCEB3
MGIEKWHRYYIRLGRTTVRQSPSLPRQCKPHPGVAVAVRGASPSVHSESSRPSLHSRAMSRLLRAGATKKSLSLALHRCPSGRLDATRFLRCYTPKKPYPFASPRAANEPRIPPHQGRRLLTNSTGLLVNAPAREKFLQALCASAGHREDGPHLWRTTQNLHDSTKTCAKAALPPRGPARCMSTQSGAAPPESSASPALAPHLYVSSNTFQKRDNLLVLDLLNTAFRRAPSEDQQFLDVGCAVGDFTRDVLLPRSSPCWRIVGTDVSSAMIAYAERYFAHPRITYDVLDLSHDVSPFVERYGSFHRVYSFFCLHWIRDQVAALRNVRNLMRPEGECLLQFCARTPVHTLWRDFARMDRWRSLMSNIEDFIPPSQDADDRLSYLENILAASSLKPHTCEVLRNVWTFPSEQHLAGSILALLPVTDGVPDCEKQELNKAMSAEMLRRCHKGPAGFSAGFDVYVVHASRSTVYHPTN